MKDIITLAIESSCDETACAVLKNGREVLSNKYQLKLNYIKNLVELYQRLHLENI
ncbi:putative tRNA threonylcarbamoyladenosine biosynthesis Gcp domain protein [[Clostridium] sordellii ATCC 9714]|nr:putative tRNA threonylcarbamoyladenosine biosynthesis Gcp domain protein [[Clostridium] sordellii ATCC 9714] [Paeniclostridium sordellii ATCC 9714]